MQRTETLFFAERDFESIFFYFFLLSPKRDVTGFAEVIQGKLRNANVKTLLKRNGLKRQNISEFIQRLQTFFFLSE